MRISDWSSDVCSSDLYFRLQRPPRPLFTLGTLRTQADLHRQGTALLRIVGRNHRIISGKSPFGAILIRCHAIVRHPVTLQHLQLLRSEEHTSELQSLMRISYAVFCLKKKITHIDNYITRLTLTEYSTL